MLSSGLPVLEGLVYVKSNVAGGFVYDDEELMLNVLRCHLTY